MRRIVALAITTLVLGAASCSSDYRAKPIVPAECPPTSSLYEAVTVEGLYMQENFMQENSYSLMVENYVDAAGRNLGRVSFSDTNNDGILDSIAYCGDYRDIDGWQPVYDFLLTCPRSEEQGFL